VNQDECRRRVIQLGRKDRGISSGYRTDKWVVEEQF